MKLLDLPPEIFQGIIKVHVENMGVVAAWDSREVCRAFNIHVKNEVLGRQPSKAFLFRAYKDNAQAQEILRQNLMTYLVYRATALHGANDMLPSLIRHTVQQLMQCENDTSEASEASCIRQVARVVVKHYANASKLVGRPTATDMKNFENENYLNIDLCIAVHLQNEKFVSHLLAQGASIWTSTRGFGISIKISALSGNESMLTLLLRHAETNKDHDQDCDKTWTLAWCMEEMLGRPQLATPAQLLLEWHVKHLKRPSNGICEILFSSALKHSMYEFIKSLLDLGSTALLRQHYAEIYFRNSYVCDSRTTNAKSAELAGFLVVRGVIDVKKLYWHNFRRQYHKEVSLLDYAVMYGNPEMVRVALEAGASPEGVRDHRGILTYPLRRALKGKGHIGIIKLLLKNGADPEGGNYPWDDDILTLTRTDSGAYKLLKTAIEKKKQNLGPDYTPPTCWSPTLGLSKRERAEKMVR